MITHLSTHQAMNDPPVRYCTCAANGLEIPSAHEWDCRMRGPYRCLLPPKGCIYCRPAGPCAYHREPPEDMPYRATPASIERAKAEAAKERAEVDAHIRAYDEARSVALLVFTELVDQVGLHTIKLWTRNLEAGLGQ